jgi:hypothetical protein
MLFCQDFHLLPGESVELRDQEVAFADLSLEVDPVFEFLLKIEYSNCGVTAKENDDVVFFFIFLLSEMEVTLHVDVVDFA